MGPSIVVTRSGGNDLHGTAFYFFRDHNLAAYPAPKPRSRRLRIHSFSAALQFGIALGGPIRHDRLFFFGSWERNEQRGVVDTTLVGPYLAHLSRITPSPFFGDQLSIRLDDRVADNHTVFVRYSHDGNGGLWAEQLVPLW